MLDLMHMARTEAEGGDLPGLLAGLYEPSEIRPDGFPDAVIWQGGNFGGDAKPVAHALTDAYAMIGTIAAADVLGLPFYMVPMWAQYRHDLDLAPLSWFGNMPCTSIKWSTAGDAYVNDGKGGRVVVKGKARQCAAPHPGRSLLQCPSLRLHHGRSIHAGPALLPGSSRRSTSTPRPASSIRR